MNLLCFHGAGVQYREELEARTAAAAALDKDRHELQQRLEVIIYNIIHDAYI